MLVSELTAQFEKAYERLQAYESRPSLWQEETRAVRLGLAAPLTSLDDALDLLHRAQRIVQVYEGRLEQNAAFKTAVESAATPLWHEFTEPPASRDLQDTLADRLYFQNPNENDKAWIIMGDQSRYIGQRLATRALKDGIPFHFVFADPNFGRLVTAHVEESRMEALVALQEEAIEGVTKRISSSPILNDYDLVPANAEKEKIFADKMAPLRKKTLSGDIDFCLTHIPSRRDAEVDGFVYEDYIKLFFEMCDQPWDHIDKAHKKLIEKLNGSTDIHITNSDGTDIRMQLTDDKGEHFTFCNSLVARNVPGSEVFSAPRIDSVNGTIVAKGKFSPGGGKIIENLTMRFKDGHLYSFDADKGGEHFQEYLDRYPANRYVGELGIGTNPHLKKHVLNGLLVEKIGGSFHLALGQCYTMTQYQGVPVYVDNGNHDTNNHWDITTMLIGKHGRITADNDVIMENGRFTDPDLAVLNDGWAAVPPGDRPAYWKDFKGYDEDGASAARPSPPAPT